MHVYGLAYTGGLTADAAAHCTNFRGWIGDGVHLAVFHGSLDWDAGDRSLPLMSAALAAAGYDYVALGHIHRPGEKKVGPGLAVYPGMVEGKGFSDPGVGPVYHRRPARRTGSGPRPGRGREVVRTFRGRRAARSERSSWT